MAETRKESRKRTMAEEEAENQLNLRPGCRRSLRNKNRIVTSPYRRMRQLFWQTDNDSDVDDENSSPLLLSIGQFKLQQVYSSPNIYVINNFLTAAELNYCDSLIQKETFSKSFVDNEQHAADDQQRTSTFVSLQKLQNATVASMESKSAQLLGLSVEQIEPLQLVRYKEGEFFGIHHDMGVLFEDNSVELPPKQVWSRRRMATLFVYLNNIPDQCGGCTYFPECNDLRVQPKRGRAVLFCNILENGMPDTKTVHAGEAVLPNNNNNNNNNKEPVIKYGMNIWACEE